jgi:hypothetical protein
MKEQLYADVIITWLGAAGVWLYISFILRHRTRNVLERSILFLLFCLFSILLVRGFFWLFRYSWLGNLEFVSAALLPLAIVIFGEGLIRRHFPLSVKVFALAAAVVFEIVNFFGQLQSNTVLLITLMTVEIVTIAATGFEILRADRSTLTRNEVQFINALVVAAVFAVPLLVTDFREEIPWIPCRLGSDGALIFIYTCVRMSNLQDTRRIVFAEILTIIARSILIAVSFMAIAGSFRWINIARYFPLALTFVLLYSILYRLKTIKVAERGRSFVRWLLLARTSSLDQFLDSLKQLPLTQEHMVLRRENLESYDLAAIFRQYGSNVKVLHLSRLKKQLKKRTAAANLEATEQLEDILERHQMSHVCLISHTPPLMLLLSVPAGVGLQLDEMKLNVIVKICRLIQKRSVE